MTDGASSSTNPRFNRQSGFLKKSLAYYVMKLNTHLLLLLFCALAVSCSPYHRLQKAFYGNKMSLQYLYTSKPAASKRDIHISIAEPVIREPRFKSGEVKRGKMEVIPLLIYNGWNYTFECSVGKNQVKENVSAFIQSALVAESNRSGIYHADTSPSPYTLEIEVDSLRSGGTQKTNGFFAYFVFVYMYSNIVRAESTPAYCRFHYRLRKGDEILLDSYVDNYVKLDILRPYPFNTQTINHYFKANLVELLSESIKLNVEKVVGAVNKKLEAEARKNEGSD